MWTPAVWYDNARRRAERNAEQLRKMAEFRLLREGRALWWALENGKPSFENRKDDIHYQDVLRWD